MLSSFPCGRRLRRGTKTAANPVDRVEVFCNHVAAAALMPRAEFLAERLIDGAAPGAIEWADADIDLGSTIQR